MATEQSTIDKITSWAGAKFPVQASPLAGMAPTVSGGSAVMNSNGTGSGTMFKSQASTATPAGIAAPAGMLGASAPASAAPAPSGMLGAAPTPAAPKTDFTSQLNDLYKSTLKRDGDAAGLAWWRERLDNGSIGIDGVRERLIDSDEYRTANNQIATPTALSARAVNAPTETVQGQLSKVLAADSPVLQQARAEGLRTGAERGLLNSSIAASAGADAVTRAATGIATADANTYGNAADYNTTAANQLYMYDRDQQNQFEKLKLQFGEEEAARQMQMQIATMQNDTTKSGQSNQMTIAQMQDQTNRWQQEQQSANSRYNTDTNYKQQVDSNKNVLVNNILNNMDISPDRKAAMLEQLGEGKSAQAGVPGSGLAGAVYVIDSVGADLNFAAAAQAGAAGVMGGF